MICVLILCARRLHAVQDELAARNTVWCSLMQLCNYAWNGCIQDVVFLVARLFVCYDNLFDFCFVLILLIIFDYFLCDKL